MTFSAGLRTAIQPWAEAALSRPLPGGFHRPLSRQASATSVVYDFVAFAHRCWMAEAFGRLPAVSRCFGLWPDCRSPIAEAVGGLTVRLPCFSKKGNGSVVHCSNPLSYPDESGAGFEPAHPDAIILPLNYTPLRRRWESNPRHMAYWWKKQFVKPAYQVQTGLALRGHTETLIRCFGKLLLPSSVQKAQFRCPCLPIEEPETHTCYQASPTATGYIHMLVMSIFLAFTAFGE